MNPRKIILMAGILGATAVMTGALGAHALKAVLESSSLESYLTASRYQMYHSIMLIGIAASWNHLNLKLAKISVIFTLIGTVLFSGSIYLLSTRSISGLEGLSFLGPITPIGGLCLITGWLSLTYAAIKK